MVSINFRVPLKLTRSYLYLVTIICFSTFILFPWSILSYLKFYSLLIPSNSYHYIDPTIEYINGKPYMIIDCDELITRILDLQVPYDLQLQLQYDYNSLHFKKFNTINYRIAIVSRQYYNSAIVDKVLSFHNKDHQAARDRWGLTWDSSSSNTGISDVSLEEWDLTWDLNVDRGLIENQLKLKRNDLVKLFQYGQLYFRDDKNWFEFGKFETEVVKVLSREKYEHLQNHKLIVEFNSKNIRIVSLRLKLVQFLQNLRFVIYNYFFISMVIGVTVFWTISLIISLIIGVVILQRFSSLQLKTTGNVKVKEEEEKIQTAKVKHEPFDDNSILSNLQVLTS